MSHSMSARVTGLTLRALQLHGKTHLWNVCNYIRRSLNKDFENCAACVAQTQPINLGSHYYGNHHKHFTLDGVNFVVLQSCPHTINPA